MLDNASTHKTPAIKRWLAAHPRFVLALHPDQLVLAQPRRTLVRRTDHQETPARHPPLRARTQRRHPRLDRTWNDNPRPYVWTKTADQILDCIARTAPELTTHDTSNCSLSCRPKPLLTPVIIQLRCVIARLSMNREGRVKTTATTRSLSAARGSWPTYLLRFNSAAAPAESHPLHLPRPEPAQQLAVLSLAGVLGADLSVDATGGPAAPFTAYGEGGVDVDGAGNVGVAGTSDHRDNRFVDEVTGVGAGDVAAEDAVGGGVGDKLHQTSRGTDRACLDDRREALTTDDDVVAGGPGSGFGRADSGDLRVDEFDVRHDPAGDAAVLAEEELR